MRRKIVKPIAGIAALLAATALPAASLPAQENPFTNEGGIAAGDTARPHAPDKPAFLRVRISKRDCRRLAIETKTADVAYEPGVDVRGNPVTGADLEGGFRYTLPDVIEFPLNFNPLEGGILDAAGFNDNNVTLGTIRYDVAKGTVTMNGKPLGDPTRAEIIEQCRAAGFVE